jgi:hypothetical protein
MRSILFILLFSFPFLAYSQFATIQNKDGMVFVRTNPDQASAVKDTLNPNDLYYYLGFAAKNSQSDWAQIDCFKNNGKHKGAGFIPKSSMKLLSVFDSLPRVKNDPKMAVFQKDSIILSVKTSDFAVKTGAKGTAREMVEHTIQKKAFGVKFNLPNTQLNAIEINYGAKKIGIPKAAIDDLYFFHLEDLKVYYDKQTNAIYILMDGSDAGDSYDVLWKIEKGKYKFRIIEVGF